MEPIRALGAMSGTSMDGVDAAELLTDGETIAGFGASDYQEYTATDRAVIAAAMGRWPGEAGVAQAADCLLYTSPSPRDRQKSRMPSSA